MLGFTLPGRILHPSPPTDVSLQSPTSTTTKATAGPANEIVQASTVAPNSAVSFTLPANGDYGLLIHLKNGQFVCYDATCTHAGCPLDFDAASSLLVCPCHGAEFDPANKGQVVRGPAKTPLTNVPIKVDKTSGAITLQ